jgi:hypothetical protein
VFVSIPEIMDKGHVGVRINQTITTEAYSVRVAPLLEVVLNGCDVCNEREGDVLKVWKRRAAIEVHKRSLRVLGRMKANLDAIQILGLRMPKGGVDTTKAGNYFVGHG